MTVRSSARHSEAGWTVTAEGPVRLAMAAAKYGCRLYTIWQGPTP
ncbi:hypothetical protein ABT373_10510 [Streptomyces sp. NPDC000070]